MPSVMADHDVEGQVNLLLRLLMSDDWLEFWLDLGYQIESFASLGTATNTSTSICGACVKSETSS